MLREHDVFAEVDEFFKNITYKDGVKFAVELMNYGLEIRIAAKLPVIDTTSGEATDVRNMMRIPVVDFPKKPDARLKFLKEEAYKFILGMEEHEVREFLRYKGEWLRDPHPENRKKEKKK